MRSCWTGALAASIALGITTTPSAAKEPRLENFRRYGVAETGQAPNAYYAGDAGAAMAPSVYQGRIEAPRRTTGGLIETVARRVNPLALENRTRSISFRPSYYDQQPVPTGRRRVFRPRILRPSTGLFGWHRGCAHCDR